MQHRIHAGEAETSLKKGEGFGLLRSEYQGEINSSFWATKTKIYSMEGFRDIKNDQQVPVACL